MRKAEYEEMQRTLDEFLPFDGMFTVNDNMIKDIILNDLRSVNKGEFFVRLLLDKIDKYNEKYLDKLDHLIDKIIDSTIDLDIDQLSELISYSNRVHSELYDNFMSNISKI